MEANVMNVEGNSQKTIRTQLLEAMKNGIFSKCERLPRETVLSQELGISRTQLRDVLSDLEREGFITRRHGVGTIINHHVLQVKNRMDIETEFLDIIQQNGYHASVGYMKVTEDTASELEAQKLQMEVHAPVIRIQLLCYADEQPAIYSEDVLRKDLVKVDYKEQEHQLDIFHFLERFCDVEAFMDLTELHPFLADKNLAEILKVSEGTPLMNMCEVDYDIEGNPIFYSQQYFVDTFFQHTVLRMKFQ